MTNASSKSPIRALINEWRASELVCTDLGEKAAASTAAFFAPTSRTFKVAYTQDEEFAPKVDPNATTSSVVEVLKEIETDSLVPAGFQGIDILQQQVNDCLARLSGWPTKKLLPLRSFGPLPIFSIAYLAGALSYCTNPFQNEAFAICIRRILFTIFQSQKQHWAQKAEPIHPYLLLHSARVLHRFEELVEAAPNDKTLAAFYRKVSNDKQIFQLFKNPKVKGDPQTVIGYLDKDFKEHLAALRDKAGAAGTIDKALLFVEGLATSQANQELARFRGEKSRQTDASILAFALNTLAEINAAKHLNLLGQGVLALADTCDNGRFQPGRPFYIDAQGRALTVPTVEISNALLAIALARVAVAQTPELQAILQITKQVESALADEIREIQIKQNVSVIKVQGWCSDRAPARNRIDGWVTANVVLFFLQRLALLAAAKRRHILTHYSWVHHARCRPEWKNIEDPNAGLSQGLKSIIEEAVELVENSKRKQAPVFLLYGPPGTSKTTLVYGIASRKKWDLVTLSPSDFISDSLDRIEVRSREIFEDLGNLNKCVILLDEMDSLFRDREVLRDKGAGTIMEFVVPALLPKLQHLRDYTLDKEIAIFFVSNYYETIDTAIRRSGRIDFHLPVLPYRKIPRSEVVKTLAKSDASNLSNTNLSILLDHIQELPCHLVYRDLQRLVQTASQAKGKDLKRSLQRLAPRLGIPPEIYRPQRRPNAHGEVCLMVARLLDIESDSLETYIKPAAALYFLKGKLVELEPYPEWKLMIELWVDRLTKDLAQMKPKDL